MGAALAYKRGDYPEASEEVRKVADSMSEEELEELASKPAPGQGYEKSASGKKEKM